MQFKRVRFVARGAAMLALSGIAVEGASAQMRSVLPTGSVILVSTAQPLDSRTARSGQTFDTYVTDTIRVDGYTVVPAGSRIRGMITFAQAATRDQSGVIEVAFDRMTMTDGAGYAMNGKLTSTDSAERRQIEAGANPRVVLFGGRGGLGAAIAGAGSRNSPASGILAALGNMLAEGRDVSLPAGTALAVQLVQPLVLRTRGIAQANNVNTVYTAADRIRAAQRELARQNYYRGALNGQLDEPTQRAIVEYQIDKGIVATGNLDWRTARSLGLVTAAAGGEVVNRSALTPEEAAALRRTAQALAGRERNELRISPSGQLDAQRSYASGEVDLWFALSAFADNASLYEQVVRVSGNAAGTTVAGQSLINAARRVDTALTQTRASSQVQNAWASIRQQLSSIASDYGR